jgi:hypothetical protein
MHECIRSGDRLRKKVAKMSAAAATKTSSDHDASALYRLDFAVAEDLSCRIRVAYHLRGPRFAEDTLRPHLPRIPACRSSPSLHGNNPCACRLLAHRSCRQLVFLDKGPSLRPQVFRGTCHSLNEHSLSAALRPGRACSLDNLISQCAPSPHLACSRSASPTFNARSNHAQHIAAAEAVGNRGGETFVGDSTIYRRCTWCTA